MNFNYVNPDDPSGQGQPAQQGYTILLGGPPPQNVAQGPQYQPSQEQLNEMHNARMRQAHAAARNQECQMIIQSMNTIKQALDGNSVTVGEGDRGSGERPPLTPAFDEINRGRLQNAYLRMTQRLINFNENFLKHECGIELSKEVPMFEKPKEE